jgi:hypothetical protein
MSGLTALIAIRDLGRVGEGTQVLINGASGGVGTFAIQIAKELGVEVTGVCSTSNVELAPQPPASGRRGLKGAPGTPDRVTRSTAAKTTPAVDSAKRTMDVRAGVHRNLCETASP